MAKTAKQELVLLIEQLGSTLREYKKAQANPPEGVDTEVLAAAIKLIEAEISELQIKLEVMVAIALFYPLDRLGTYTLTLEQLSA